MKPDWDKLAEEFKDSPNVAIYDVDCTAKGEKLCTKVGVSGYPTIKYYLADDPKAKDFNEGRDYKSIKKFVEKTFKAGCKIDTKEGCNEDQKKIIDELKDKPVEDVKAYAKKKEDEAQVLKDKRWAHVEESKKVIKQLKKEEAALSLKKNTAQRIIDHKDPPKKEEKEEKEEL